jgi:hypothetical protein
MLVLDERDYLKLHACGRNANATSYFWSFLFVQDSVLKLPQDSKIKGFPQEY